MPLPHRLIVGCKKIIYCTVPQRRSWCCCATMSASVEAEALVRKGEPEDPGARKAHVENAVDRSMSRSACSAAGFALLNC